MADEQAAREQAVQDGVAHVDPWTDDEAFALAVDVQQGRAAICPRCGGWVQGTVVMSAPTLRKPVRLECGDCMREAEAFGGPDNENRRLSVEEGGHLVTDRREGRALVCPLCSAAIRLLRDELPNGIEIFAYDCVACGAAYYEAGGVM